MMYVYLCDYNQYIDAWKNLLDGRRPVRVSGRFVKQKDQSATQTTIFMVMKGLDASIPIRPQMATIPYGTRLVRQSIRKLILRRKNPLIILLYS